MKYPVNKGAGNPVEFKGLKSQYLFVFAGGLVMVLLAVVILYLVGVDQWICISFGSISGGLLVWMTFRLNARYVNHGLMKLLAEKRHPRYLIHRKRVFRLFTKRKNKNHEKCFKGGNARTQIPPSLSRERLHREQGRRPDRGFRGGAARVVHGDGGRV